MRCPQVKIGEYVDFEQPIPQAVKNVKPSTSRMLDAMEKKYAALKDKKMDAISYAAYVKLTETKEEKH